MRSKNIINLSEIPFTFYPAILNDEKLWNIQEKILCCFIYQIQSKGKRFYISDRILCLIMGIDQSTLDKMVQSLTKRGILFTDWYEHGRVLELVVPENKKQEYEQKFQQEQVSSEK